MKKNSIAQIIPALRLKRDLHFFDYEIPAQLQEQAQIGQLVEIPFRNQMIKGVILNLAEAKSQNEYTLKPINKILDPLPFLAKWQLDLIQDLSEYYFVSMGVLLKMIIPDIPKRAKNSEEKFINEIKFLKAPKEALVNDFYQNKPVLLQYYDFEDKIKIYLGLIKKAIEQNKQVAIICPQLINVKKIYQYLGDYEDKLSIFLNDLPKNKYWQEYQKIKNGQAKIILGTRSAIFAPFNNLDLIIIDEEDNENHKQEEPNPRYNAKTIALKLKDLLDCKIIFASATPSLSSLYKVENKEWEYFEIDKPQILPQIEIIDKKEEFKKGNYQIFSEALIKNIESNLNDNKKIFLFLNRRGLATLSTCKDCGYIVSCPVCKLPLTYFANKKMVCNNCGHEEELILFCPECKSPNIKLSGTGTEKVEIEIKKIFPKAKVSKIDPEISLSKKNLSEFDIIIGTQYAFDFVNWEQISLVGVINADTLFYLPDYRSLERTFSLMAKLVIFIGVNSKKIIIQTSASQNYIFADLKNLDFKTFYNNEIKERKELGYPPIIRLVKLMYQSYEFNAGQKEVEEVYKVLKLKVESSEVIIHAPSLIYSQQVRGRFRWQIIIKVLAKKAGLDFLKNLPDDVIIDVEPESLL